MSQEVFLPQEIKQYSPINPKIGIKPSMPKLDELIIFSILLWKIGDSKSKILYSKQVENKIEINDEILQKTLDFFNESSLDFRKEDGSEIKVPRITNEVISENLNDNPLFTAQMEPLYVSLTLYFKLAKVEFVDFSNAQEERSGGNRYSKILEFTTNMDLLDFLINEFVDDFKRLCLKILFKIEIEINEVFFSKLKKILLIFSESVLFKLRHDSDEIVFNQIGIYSQLVEGKRVLSKDSKEYVGPMRIINSSISKNLHPFITKSSDEFIINNISIEELKEYSERVSNFLEISPVTYDFKLSSSLAVLEKENSNEHEFGSYDYKNMLLKGVPGTGKSHKIDDIIENKLKIINSKNKLRINIHAASSNSDLIQGIGINSDDGNIKYLEKQGIILNFIIIAIMNPDEPFALVLEEIQENSLNELVGDLIYLLEESKRTNIRKEIDNARLILSDYEDYQNLLDELIKRNPKINHVQIPYLIQSETKFRNFVLPDNLYLFLTSNYRDDKKVIEDNLLRRIATFEIFPKYKDILGEHFKSEEVSKFLRQLNESILNQFKDREVHPDRFLIGHANWLKVETEKKFYESLLKVIIEFQDIKELYYSDVHDILKSIENYPSFLEEEIDNKIKGAERYFDIIELLQDKIFND